jgi:hypothetical protein
MPRRDYAVPPHARSLSEAASDSPDPTPPRVRGSDTPLVDYRVVAAISSRSAPKYVALSSL